MFLLKGQTQRNTKKTIVDIQSKQTWEQSWYIVALSSETHVWGIFSVETSETSTRNNWYIKVISFVVGVTVLILQAHNTVWETMSRFKEALSVKS